MSTQLQMFEEPSGPLRRLVRLAIDLGAASFGGALSGAERALAREAAEAPPTPARELDRLRAALRAGADPLGEAMGRACPLGERRLLGAFYTPTEIVQPMMAWVAEQQPDRIVDAGCGTGRFAAEAARRLPEATVVAVDVNPLSTLLTRAHLAVLGARRARVMLADYTHVRLPSFAGRTAFVGNPPYVRHHELGAARKRHGSQLAARLGLRMSRLAGLHAYFYLATAHHAKAGDVGCFVASAEWLDVNYGRAMRALLAGRLGLEVVQVIDPRALPFPDAMTTACVTCFRTGSARDQIVVHVATAAPSLGTGGRIVSRRELRSAARWGGLLRNGAGADPESPGRLGHLFRVSRGVVTGANEFFALTRPEARARGLLRYTRPVLSRAEEILKADGMVYETPERVLLLDPPADTDLEDPGHAGLRAYLEEGERRGVARGYICTHRRPWWRVGHGPAPAIVATYMARQPPKFALNPDGLGILNVVHGLHPRVSLGAEQLARIVRHLNENRERFAGRGRTYQGGLEKFEPREMEALPLPPVGEILEGA